MINNYFLIKKLGEHLEASYTGAVLQEVFSLAKDDLVLVFSKQGTVSFFRVLFYQDQILFQFPEELRFSQRKHLKQFKDLHGLTIKGLRFFGYERSFAIEFDQARYLLFKMHGRNGNVISIHNSENILFRPQFIQDQQLNIEQLAKPHEVDYTELQEALQQGDPYKALRQHIPILDKPVLNWLKQEKFHDSTLTTQLDTIKKLFILLEQPSYRITSGLDDKTSVSFSLLPTEGEVWANQDLAESLNQYFKWHLKNSRFQSDKKIILSQLNRENKQVRGYLAKANQKLEEIETGVSFEEVGNIIMANLHVVDTGVTEVELLDFYRNQPVNIKLKKEFTPQQNAARYYQKSKNRKIEIKQLEQSIAQKQKRLEELMQLQKQVSNAESKEELPNGLATPKSGKPSVQKQLPEPFKRFRVYGFEVLVGKDAKSNDELTLRFAKKNDLWLHARDYSGSHVIVKQKDQLPFPDQVIEAAASIAAYYSKGKSNSLLPVMYTPRKFVRKPKGAAAGAVKVEKESVTLVPPALPE